MAQPTCHSCVYAYWDRGLWLRTLASGFPARPFCANHPDSLGREREVPYGDVCRNYRPRPKTPDLADGTVKRIPITGGFIAYVDAADYPQISRWRWHMESGGYAMRTENGRKVYMHREIMNPPKGKVVDHIDRNRLDNTRANLHICTPAENRRNHPKHRGSSSRYFGVCHVKNRDKWLASLFLNGRRTFIGHYDSEIEAARAYDRAAVEQLGESARLNFPDEWPPAKRRRIYRAAQKKAKSRPAGTKRTKGQKRQGSNKKPHAEPCPERSRTGTAGRRAPKRKGQ